jgi:hypothetical protein
MKERSFYMKKIMNKINFALIGLMVSVPALAETAASGTNNDMCNALKSLSGVFALLRTMAFIGAAFYIAGWAWGFISSGKAEMKDVKDKGIGLLVGFSLLFLVGILLSFVMSTTGQGWIGCKEVIRNFGNVKPV